MTTPGGPNNRTDQQQPYVLGAGEIERQRLQRQHQIWRAAMQQGWDRAGFGSGQRILDLGCGPGNAALDLAERVGPAGVVLAIDNAAPFLDHLQRQAQEQNLPQLSTRQVDLAVMPSATAIDTTLGLGRWDGAWCRWTAMFLSDPSALIATAAGALRPGGRLVLHEYVQWDTFALHPEGDAVGHFVQQCIAHWQAHGGDPHVGRRLPGLLAEQGLQLLQARSLMACEPSDGPKAQWLQDFLRCYTPQLAAAGRWSTDDQLALEHELARSARHPSLWVTPALVEQIWEKPA